MTKNHWTHTVPSEPTYEREAPSINGLGRVHVIIFAMDYEGTDAPLNSCIRDGKAMADLARTHCGVTSIIEHYERQCTPAALEHAFGQARKRMQNDDYLVFYFSGLGADSSSASGDEDMQVFSDETPLAFSLFDDAGNVAEYSCARFAELVSSSVNSRGRILMMLDCGLGSSMVDFLNPIWDDLEVIALSGAEDKDVFHEDSEELGLFTWSVLSAVSRLKKEGDSHYSVGAVFNKMLAGNARLMYGEQPFWLEHSIAVSTSSMAWPLLPTTKYRPEFLEIHASED